MAKFTKNRRSSRLPSASFERGRPSATPHNSTSHHSHTNSNKANVFHDRRIGQQRHQDDVATAGAAAMLQRVVQERLRRSRRQLRQAKFALEDEDDSRLHLTHAGKAITDESLRLSNDGDAYSDNEEDLDRFDTQLHFGGGSLDLQHGSSSYYGNAVPNTVGTDLAQAYAHRDLRILQGKKRKMEKIQSKEDQVDAFQSMDESFAELAQLLQFRNKQTEEGQDEPKRKNVHGENRSAVHKAESNTALLEEKEMDEWNREMKTYLFERKVQATDRTQTPEEIAQREAQRLNKLETRRLARMHGEFEDEDLLSDISDEEEGRERRKEKRNKGKEKKRIMKKKKDHWRNPDEMSDSEEEVEGDGREVRFTSDGLMLVDKFGKVVGEVGQEEKVESNGEEASESDIINESSEDDSYCSNENSAEERSDDWESEAEVGTEEEPLELEKGMKVQGNYHAKEQYGGKENWYNGVISVVRKDSTGNVVYDVAYDDGDFEEGMSRMNVRPLPKSLEETEEQSAREEEIVKIERKKLKAKMRAKKAIPFVFEAPTTLEALHDMISKYAATGADASLIIQRIHATNSVRLNHKNKERMQNFYDVLLRRFIAVGDEIFHSGNGGPDLERYEQLNSLTKTLYVMSQDSPECAGAVWSRRLGIFQKALTKRLRDAEISSLGDNCRGEFTAWPSTGMLLLMRALPHIFPSTDKRHPVVSPALLLLGQILAQSPIQSQYDIVVGLFCSGLMLQYTKDAKRIPPEAIAFLAGVLRLFANDIETALVTSPLPSLCVGNRAKCLMNLRKQVCNCLDKDIVPLSLEKKQIQSHSTPQVILNFTLHLVKQSLLNFGESDEGSEREIFSEIMKSILYLDGTRNNSLLPLPIRKSIVEIVSIAKATCASEAPRRPLARRKGATVQDLAVQTLAPRMEDPMRYRRSKDMGKSQMKTEHDRNLREYKQERKAAMKELRLDSAFIERERRRAKDHADKKAKEIRFKNFSWLEQEQATMNQQVRLGGGLLTGGGVSAARQKARSGKLGIKKGGKFK